MHEVQMRGSLPARHVRPTSVESVVEVLAEFGSRARLIAGGTDLILEFARGQHRDVELLVDLSALRDVDTIDGSGERITLGMLVTHNQIVASREIWERARPLAEACFEIGSPQLRNRATVVGNVATASPANDTITALRVLDADVTLRSTAGERTVALADFHSGVRSSVRRADELITQISFRRLAENERGVFVKAGLRAAQAISVVHAALVVAEEDGLVTRAKVALGSVAPTIVEAPVENLIGQRLSADVIKQAAEAAASSVTPIDDVRASAQYRSQAVRIMVERGLTALSEDRPVPPAAVLLSASGTAYGPPKAASINNIPVPEGALAQSEKMTLLDWLRDVAGPAIGESLTGTKEGCAEGECGACTVQMNGAAVMACLVLARSAEGASVVTVEGIAGDDELHPVQKAFVEHFAVQCGYCIPGFIVAGASLLGEIDAPNRQQVIDGLAGNLCRCTGYYKIIDAVMDAGQ